MSFISLQRRMWKHWGREKNNNKKGTEGEELINFELYRDFNHTGMHCKMWSHVAWDYLLFREKCGMNYGGRASLTWRLQSLVVCSGMQMGGWKISVVLTFVNMHMEKLNVTATRDSPWWRNWCHLCTSSVAYLCGFSDVKGKCLPCWCFILS